MIIYVEEESDVAKRDISSPFFILEPLYMCLCLNDIA